jgi:hypothetical protein
MKNKQNSKIYIFNSRLLYFLSKIIFKKYLKAIHIIQDNNNDLPIINESTSLAMYYG